MAVGLGFRRELAGALLAAPGAVDFVEVVAEAYREPGARRELAAFRELWPVIPHGVKCSLGGAEGLDLDRARNLAAVAAAARAPVVSEHVAFVRAGGREIGHLTELPLTRQAARVVTRNVDRLRRMLPDVPLLLENVARGFLFPDGEMGEGTFHAEVAEATGCDLLLDVGNLYANAVNAGRDPEALLAEYPLDRVAMLHVAGGVWEHGFYYDTHAHPIPPEVLALTARALERVGPVPILLERDAGFERVEDVLDEVARLRALDRGGALAVARGRRPGVGSPPSSDEPAAELAELQTSVAERLVADLASLDRAKIELDPATRRARGILERKRIDDALPLLPSLSARLSIDDARALGGLGDRPRAPRMVAIDDARAIARTARARPELAAAAAEDELALDARFSFSAEGPAPRRGPFVGRTEVAGVSLWVWKGPGRDAPVRVVRR